MALSFLSGYSLSSKSRVSRRSNIISAESEAGTMRFIDLSATTRWLIIATLEALSETEMNTLVDWLETNSTTEIDLPVGVENYYGYVVPSAPVNAKTHSRGGNLWMVSFQFNGIKQ